MTGETLTIKADGASLAATLWRPAAQPPRAACLINGALGVPRHYYARFAEWLAENGVAVLTYDYSGMHGSLTGHARGSDATATDWGRRDTAAAISFLTETFPGTPAMLIAQSMGGHVFPLAENATRLTRIVTITSQSGYWGHWPRKGQWTRLRRYYAELPAAARLLGFVPAKAGLGADLPAGVALEWTRWCRARDYITASRFGFRGHFDAVSAAMTCVGFSDDPLAPRAAVDAYAGFFRNAKPEVVWIDPQTYNIAEIGHFGFFRASVGKPLWPLALAWLGLKTEVTGSV